MKKKVLSVIIAFIIFIICSLLARNSGYWDDFLVPTELILLLVSVFIGWMLNRLIRDIEIIDEDEEAAWKNYDVEKQQEIENEAETGGK